MKLNILRRRKNGFKKIERTNLDQNANFFIKFFHKIIFSQNGILIFLDRVIKLATKYVIKILCLGGSPGLLVMGGDSCSKGHEIESWHRILDGHFLHTYLL